MLGQPHLDAVVVEPVLARELGDLRAQRHGIHADRALGLALTPQHLLVDLLLGQRVDGRLGRRRRRRPVHVLIDQLRDHPVQLLLRVHRVAVPVEVQKRRQHRQRIRAGHHAHPAAGTAWPSAATAEVCAEEFKDTGLVSMLRLWNA